MSFCPELTTVKYRLQSNFQIWTSILQKRLIWPHIFSEQFNFKDAKRTSVKLVLEISTVPAMIIPTHLKQFFRKGNRTKKSKSFPWQKFFASVPELGTLAAASQIPLFQACPVFSNHNL
jgi:hypothetical protein